MARNCILSLLLAVVLSESLQVQSVTNNNKRVGGGSRGSRMQWLPVISGFKRPRATAVEEPTHSDGDDTFDDLLLSIPDDDLSGVILSDLNDLQPSECDLSLDNTSEAESKRRISLSVSLPLPFSREIAYDKFSVLSDQPRWSPWLHSVSYVVDDRSESMRVGASDNANCQVGGGVLSSSTRMVNSSGSGGELDVTEWVLRVPGGLKAVRWRSVGTILDRPHRIF
mmetsp:Transcript_6183/g.13360  ORF Transcript_6183/g.13360 Transcript_6183/m.13360 type:complete len:225 (-) Transcript_6183:1945-2619(-)